MELWWFSISLIAIHSIMLNNGFKTLNGTKFPPILSYAEEDISKILVGNKTDLSEKRKVSYKEGQALGLHF